MGDKWKRLSREKFQDDRICERGGKEKIFKAINAYIIAPANLRNIYCWGRNYQIHGLEFHRQWAGRNSDSQGKQFIFLVDLYRLWNCQKPIRNHLRRALFPFFSYCYFLHCFHQYLTKDGLLGSSRGPPQPHFQELLACFQIQFCIKVSSFEVSNAHHLATNARKGIGT